jgi:hypothetical protein
MRRLLMLAVFAFAFALGGSTALANPNNDGRIGRADPPSTPNGGADGVPCAGLYEAADVGRRTEGTPGFAHVEENDFEMCHGFSADVP